MPVLLYEEETPERAKVMLIHNQPDKDPEVRKKGIEIEKMPAKPDLAVDEKALPYCNPKTGEVWYEVVEGSADDPAAMAAQLDRIEDKLDQLIGLRVK